MLLHFRKHTFDLLAVWPSEEAVVILFIDITLRRLCLLWLGRGQN